MDGEKRKGLHQMDCYSSAISTSLAGFGDFFLGYWVWFSLQNYVVVIKEKKKLVGDQNFSFYYFEHPVLR